MLPTPIVKNVDYDRVYEPAEDSFLLLDCLEEQCEFLQSRFKGIVPVVTEIGGGSGIVTSFLHKSILPDAIYIATDINPHACQAIVDTVKLNRLQEKHWAIPNLVDSCQMDLTTAIKPHTIDLLVFNPPYVPAGEVPHIPNDLQDDAWLDLALLGGADGMVITWKILNQLDSVLTPTHGVAYILFCARNKPEQVTQVMTAKGWKVDTVIFRKAGWEELSILKFTRI